MNNWEKYKEDIEKITENSKTTIMCVVNEFSKVCNCSDCDECQRKNVEWLTQEAESNLKYIGDEKELKEYDYDLDRDVSEAEICVQEAESEERNCAYCKYTDVPGFLEPCKGCMTQNRKDDTYPYFEPQNEEEEHYKETHACKFYGNHCGNKCDGLDKNCDTCAWK